jgi:hypothetical protein
MKALVSGVLVLVIAGSALQAARHVLDDESAIVWRASLDEQRQRSQELEAAMEARREFMVQLHALLEEFERGTATLPQTVQAIEQLAIIQRPEFLSQLLEIEDGDALQEKIAHNVVRHFEERHRRLRTSMSRQLLSYAERELAAFVNHDHQPSASIH